jgi:hypothetical protein
MDDTQCFTHGHALEKLENHCLDGCPRQVRGVAHPVGQGAAKRVMEKNGGNNRPITHDFQAVTHRRT